MSLSIGIVGLPNVGKSTLFNALVRKNQAEVSNYPFCTIEPNVGIVEVPDKRLSRIADLIANPKSEALNSKQILNSKSKISNINPNIKKIPAPLKFIDIAGLVKGAHKGEGLGNKFLSHIQECDAIAMVIRAFPEKKIALSESSLDPQKDAQILTSELILKDLEVVEKQIESTQADIKANQKEARKRLEVLEKIKTALLAERTVSSVILRAGLEAEPDDDQRELIRGIPLLTLKPIMYIINISEDQIPTPSSSPPFQGGGSGGLSSPSFQGGGSGGLSSPPFQGGGSGGKPVLYICAKTEADLADFSDTEASEYLKSIGAEKSGLEQIIHQGYQLLNLITFYTIKISEQSPGTSDQKNTISDKRRAINQIQAWPIPENTPAPRAAGLIHTDFEKGFIKAEVVKYQDLIETQSLDKARDKGKDYLIEDGDIIHFKFSN